MVYHDCLAQFLVFLLLRSPHVSPTKTPQKVHMFSAKVAAKAAEIPHISSKLSISPERRQWSTLLGCKLLNDTGIFWEKLKGLSMVNPVEPWKIVCSVIEYHWVYWSYP